MIRKKAFTLIELLVVISIIGLLSSIVTASLNSARSKARISAGRQFGAQAYRIAADQAVGIWDFDECSGSLAKDRSGLGYNGILNGMATSTWPTDTPSGAGCSIAFDGSNDYISPAVDLGFRGDVEITVSAWFKPTGANSGNFPAIVDFQSMGGSCTGLYFTIKDNRPSIDFGSNRWRTTTGVSLNEWHQIVVTKRAGLISSTSKIYVDGVEASSALEAADCVPNVSAPAGGGLVIGRLTHTAEYVSGLIDEVRVFAKHLSASEVHELYVAEAPKFKLAHSVE